MKRWINACFRGGCAVGMTALALLCSADFAHAKVAAADPVDTEMRACLARADRSSMAGQVQCTDEARDAWNSEVKKGYASLGKALPAARRKRWQLSQKRWNAWRNADDMMLDRIFRTTSGSADVLYKANMRLQPVRARALMLRDALAQVEEGRRVLRVRACSLDRQCEHAIAGMGRYYRRLYTSLPVRSRPVLARSQRAWQAYYTVTTPLAGDLARLDLIGARAAMLKRLAEMEDGD